MKTLRISAALYCYEKLLTGQPLHKETAIQELGISPTTFKRVISDLRCYLEERHVDRELVFHRRDETYLLREIRL